MYRTKFLVSECLMFTHKDISVQKSVFTTKTVKFSMNILIYDEIRYVSNSNSIIYYLKPTFCSCLWKSQYEPYGNFLISNFIDHYGSAAGRDTTLQVLDPGFDTELRLLSVQISSCLRGFLLVTPIFLPPSKNILIVGLPTLDQKYGLHWQKPKH